MSKQPTQGEDELADPHDDQTAMTHDDGTASADELEPQLQGAAGAEQAAAAEQPITDVAALQGEVERLRADLEQEREASLRARADVENFRRRAERDVEKAHKFGQERFATELLPVIDSLELGLSAAQDDTVSVASVREGLEMTVKMFGQAAEKFGLEQVDPIDSAFDPEYHQAISMQESDKAASGTVLNVVQKGYLLHGRVLRPAMVIVAK